MCWRMWGAWIWACVIGISGANGQSLASVQLQGALDTCSRDTMLLFDLEMDRLRPLAAFPLTLSEGGHQFNVQLGSVQPGFYLVGNGRQEGTIPLLLGSDPMIKLLGSCDTLSRARVQSAGTQAYQALMKERNALSEQFQQALGQMRRAQRDSAKKAQVLAQIKQIDNAQLDLLKQAQDVAPVVGAAIGLQTYLSYQLNGTEGVGEGSYLLRNFFAQAPLESPLYDRVPELRQRFQRFGQSLPSLGLPHDSLVSGAGAVLARMPVDSRRYHAALRGIVEGVKGRDDDLFATFSGQYLKRFPTIDPVFTQSLQQEISRLDGRLLGQLARNFKLQSTSGDSLSLADFRGSYLLVDFWASWCGPCRRENPKVRAAYERFHAAGFEILGVSLDNNDSRWRKAIEKDKLGWPQVSDLKGWRSQAAGMYGIRSIPATILLDPEGRIIAKNLRGDALERKLEELLGGE